MPRIWPEWGDIGKIITIKVNNGNLINGKLIYRKNNLPMIVVISDDNEIIELTQAKEWWLCGFTEALSIR